jgi:coatomer protein complex subunit alpha (xenin)
MQTFRREHDRFWILAAHPEINLLAAGHDSGMIVFKLARERPPHAVHGTTAFYFSNLILRSVDLKTGRVDTIQSLPKPASQSPKAAVVRSISYNPAEHALLVNTDEEGGTYKLYKLPAASNGAVNGRGEIPADSSGIATTAVFIARNRFAAWDRPTSSIHIRNLQNEITKRCVRRAWETATTTLSDRWNVCRSTAKKIWNCHNVEVHRPVKQVLAYPKASLSSSTRANLPDKSHSLND